MAFDWLFICDDPSDVRDLRVKVVVKSTRRKLLYEGQ